MSFHLKIQVGAHESQISHWKYDWRLQVQALPP
ncbi:CII family transcriptional regulator [Stenotrophomonas indicatrix]